MPDLYGGAGLVAISVVERTGSEMKFAFAKTCVIFSPVF